MKLAKAIKVLKTNTMACWWPNGSYPGKQGTDFAGIGGEVKHLLRGILERQDIPANAPVFTLDSANPETALYDELLGAWIAFREAVSTSGPAALS